MKKFTFSDDGFLEQLYLCSDLKSKNKFINEILRRIWMERPLEREDCGRTLEEILEEDEFENFAGICKGLNDEDALEFIKKLRVMGVAFGGCPECGCELTNEEDGVGREVWTEWSCTNSECDFKDTNEPDWDLQRDEV